jgi:hypothetical protein
MKNAIVSGIIISIVSIIWIIFLHLLDFDPLHTEATKFGWFEYTTLLIPVLGLFLGIRQLKKKQDGKLNFIEGIFEGFKILAVAAVLSGTFLTIYLNIYPKDLAFDYMEKIFALLTLGLLSTLANSLLLMNTTPEDL